MADAWENLVDTVISSLQKSNSCWQRLSARRAIRPGKRRVFSRNWEIEQNTKHELRFVFIDKSIDVYLDDRYVVNDCIVDFPKGGIALTALGGEVECGTIDYYKPLPDRSDDPDFGTGGS